MDMFTEKEPLVSVIVPVYNAQRFLRDCLDSLLNQNLDALEILCVNDGSTDDSRKILEEYAQKHSQIRVIDQANAGVSAARNAGIQAARGKYIAFCDSDDYFADGILGLTARHMVQHDMDIGFYNEVWVPEECQYRHEGVEQDAAVTFGIDEHIRNTVHIFLMLVSRAHLLKNQIQFHSRIAYAEDVLFLVDLLRCVDSAKVLRVHQIGCFHRVNSESVMNAPKAKRMPRHYQSMRILAKELQNRLAEGIADVEMERYVRNLLNIVVCNAQYDGIFLTDRTPEGILKELREDGIYPQPFNRKYLRITTLKDTIFNYMRFLFPIPLYYSVLARAARFALKLKNRNSNW